jgi:hypothetical protein
MGGVTSTDGEDADAGIALQPFPLLQANTRGVKMSTGALDLFISLIAEVDRVAMEARAPHFQQDAPFFSFLFFTSRSQWRMNRVL